MVYCVARPGRPPVTPPTPPQVQFVLTITHTLSAVVKPCGFPFGCLIFQSSYMLTLVILFLNFYVQVSEMYISGGGT